MPFGISSTGFVMKTLADVRSGLNTAARSRFGNAVNVDPRSRMGQLIGIFSEQISEVWELAQALATAFDPRAATGLLLDNLLALTGLTRIPAAKSTVTLTLTGDDGTVVALGKKATVGTSSVTFETLTAETITLVPVWAGTTAYVVGDRVGNGGNVYECTVAGTSDASPGPSGTGLSIDDGGVTWAYLGEGDGAVDVEAEATVTGPLQGYSRTIDTIATPVSGWSTVVNLLDAIPGRNIEGDAEARLRRELFLAQAGTSTFPGLYTALAGVSGVTRATLFENCTDNTVGNLTPHSVEALMEGGTDAAIRQTLFDSKPAGIETVGTTSGVVADSGGTNHTIKFSRVELVDIYVDGAIETTGDFPLDGEAQVEAAVVAFGNAKRAGNDVVPAQLSAAIFDTVAGVKNIVDLQVGLTITTAAAVINITQRQKADYDTSRIAFTFAAADSP